MLVGRVNVPCGCEARKDVMFTHGQLGRREAAIVGLTVAVLVFAFTTRPKGRT